MVHVEVGIKWNERLSAQSEKQQRKQARKEGKELVWLVPNQEERIH